MFSKACEYGIKAVLLVAAKSLENERTTLKQIVQEIEAPEAFTAKVLQKLAKHKIISSSKGPKGGFYVENEAIDNIKLMAIVEAIDGNKIINSCGLGLPQCDTEHPCPIHDQLIEIRKNLKNMLVDTSIHRLATEVNNGLVFLKK